MGYKTDDLDERLRLEKEGHKLIGIIGVPYGNPFYEFDFDKEPVVKKEVKKEEPKVEVVKKEVKKPKKKR